MFRAITKAGVGIHPGLVYYTALHCHCCECVGIRYIYELIRRLHLVELSIGNYCVSDVCVPTAQVAAFCLSHRKLSRISKLALSCIRWLMWRVLIGDTFDCFRFDGLQAVAPSFLAISSLVLRCWCRVMKLFECVPIHAVVCVFNLMCGRVYLVT